MKKEPKYYVYVIDLDRSIYQNEKKFREANSQYEEEGKPCVYVGQSFVEPKERFQQHKSGYKSNKYARKYGLCLKKNRIPHKNPHFTRKAVKKREEEVAKILKKRRWAVWWN